MFITYSFHSCWLRIKTRACVNVKFEGIAGEATWATALMTVEKNISALLWTPPRVWFVPFHVFLTYMQVGLWQFRKALVC